MERRGDLMTMRPIDGAPRGGGSTWQSIVRGTGSVEADQLNGEIVLLGRLHGVPTPVNDLLRRHVKELARRGGKPGDVSEQELLAALDHGEGWPATRARPLALGRLECQMDERKEAILRAVVQEYIETAQPVGSGHVSSAPGVDVSSATVRNEMALLEQEGYLRQPHTSAGRVPTEKGYRFFVDDLDVAGLRVANAEQVRAFFRHAHGELEDMLSETSRLLSNLTNCAGVVIGPTTEDATVRSVQLVGLGGSSALLVVVLSSGTIEKHTVDLPGRPRRRARRRGERASCVAPRRARRALHSRPCPTPVTPRPT